MHHPKLAFAKLDCLRKKPHSFISFLHSNIPNTANMMRHGKQTESGRNTAIEGLDMYSQKPLEGCVALPRQLQGRDPSTVLISSSSSLALVTKFYFILKSGENGEKYQSLLKGENSFKMMCIPTRLGCIF